MYRVTLKDGRVIELTTKHIKVLLENWDKPEVEAKINQIKDWEKITQQELTGFEKFRIAGMKLKRRE